MTVALGLASLLIAAGSCSAEEIRPLIALRTQVAAEGPEVLLGQIAEITAPAELAGKLAAVSLGSAPVAGSQRTLQVGYLKLRLRRFGVNPETVDWQGESVMVAGKPTVSQVTAAVVDRPGAQPSAAVPDQAAPLLVKRNQLVEVQVQCGGVTIHATGRAMADAADNELVKVTLDGSKRVLTTRVTGPAQTICSIARSTP